MRLETGALSVAQRGGCARRRTSDGMQLHTGHLHRLRGHSSAEIERIRDGTGYLRFLVPGDFLGAARTGHQVADEVERVRIWLERAVALGSPILRVASAFYRAELAGQPDLIQLEHAFVTAVLDRRIYASLSGVQRHD